MTLAMTLKTVHLFIIIQNYTILTTFLCLSNYSKSSHYWLHPIALWFMNDKIWMPETNSINWICQNARKQLWVNQKGQKNKICFPQKIFVRICIFSNKHNASAGAHTIWKFISLHVQIQLVTYIIITKKGFEHILYNITYDMWLAVVGQYTIFDNNIPWFWKNDLKRDSS